MRQPATLPSGKQPKLVDQLHKLLQPKPLRYSQALLILTIAETTVQKKTTLLHLPNTNKPNTTNVIRQIFKIILSIFSDYNEIKLKITGETLQAIQIHGN